MENKTSRQNNVLNNTIREVLWSFCKAQNSDKVVNVSDYSYFRETV